MAENCPAASKPLRLMTLITAAVHFGGQTRNQHLTSCCVLKEDTCLTLSWPERSHLPEQDRWYLAESITTLQARHCKSSGFHQVS